MVKKCMGLLIMLTVLIGCSGQPENDRMKFERLADIPADKLEALSQKSFFFGHQSVGRNILEGLRILMNENPALKIQIVQGVAPELAKPGVFLQENLGSNRFPLTKLTAFEQAMDGGLGNKVDAAFLKFCYVDMDRMQDPEKLFTDS